MDSLTAPDTTASQFVDWTRRAMTHELTALELIGAAEALAGRDEPSLAQQLYRTWIEHNPKAPLLHAVMFNYGVMLNAAGDLPRARDAFAEAIRINPDLLPPYINLGTLLERTGHVDQAAQQWLALVSRLASVTGDTVLHKSLALKQLGRVLEAAHDQINAEKMLEQSLDLNPHQRDAIQHWIALQMSQCKWPVIKPRTNLSRKMLMNAISPLSLAAYVDDPLFQLGNAHQYCKLEVSNPNEPYAISRWAPAGIPRPKRLRIGYLSSDLREHAVGFLTSELFELHNRATVEVFAYYCGIVSNDATQARIKRTVDHWRDVSRMSDDEATQQIMNDGIDILIDLNGYTKDARTKVLARRPAPIIVNWLGYPGTMASPHHDYIVADDFIIPPASERFYTEKVLRLPCYQPNDRRRVIGEQRPTRQEVGLPENGVVFCCFNGSQKITRHTFQRWMTILKRVPDSVLWLLSNNATVDERLRQLAAQDGVTPERIVFAQKKGNADHLARYPLADLFLDTSPYGAHTTASDALWMGVPVLTAPGRGFASRVCGSLARSAGLSELVCDSLDAYVTTAIELGHDRARLARYRDQLKSTRDSCVLFDTPALVKQLEALFEGMWKDYARREMPQPDLSNLELYQEIACEQDHESAEFQADPDYERRYRAVLAKRHQMSPIRADQRLWTREVVAEVDAGIRA